MTDYADWSREDLDAEWDRLDAVMDRIRIDLAHIASIGAENGSLDAYAVLNLGREYNQTETKRYAVHLEIQSRPLEPRGGRNGR